jgi:cholest-4-en-3-one 26-monooxygenase
VSLRAPSVNVLSSATYRHGVPHEALREMRLSQPVQKVAPQDGALVDSAWAVLSHDLVSAVSVDHRHFTSSQGVSLHRRWVFTEPNLLSTDDPEHAKLRELVRRGFTPRVVKGFTDHYAHVAREVVRRALRAEEFDFVPEVAAQLPLFAICELMGAPAEDRMQIMRWSNALVGDSDPDYAGSGQNLWDSLLELHQYIERLVQEKSRQPTNDVTSSLISQRDSGALSTAELVTFIVLLLTGGNESTRNNMSLGVLALIEHPEQLAILRRDPEGLIDTAVDEIIRWASPLLYMARTVTSEIELGGQMLRTGDKVAMMYCSANRDEKFFDRPDRFDVARSPNRYLSFGVGPHHCLGAPMAKLETKVLLLELLRQVDDIQLAGPVQRLQSSFLNGIKSFPVRVRRHQEGP